MAKTLKTNHPPFPYFAITKVPICFDSLLNFKNWKDTKLAKHKNLEMK